MNFTPAPTLISTVVSLFQKRTPQPSFTPAAPPVLTQVYVSRTMTTHCDPPISPDSPTVQPSASDKKRKDQPLSLLATNTSEKGHHLHPETPCAPNAHRTTFVVPLHDRGSGRCYGGDDDQSSFREVDLDVPPGHGSVCHPTEQPVCTVVEPKILARALFFLGFGWYYYLILRLKADCFLLSS